MTKGLNSVQISTGGYSDRPTYRGRGRPRGSVNKVRGRGRGRGRGSAVMREPKTGTAKVIKCDQCGKEFPANVDESVLVHHI